MRYIRTKSFITNFESWMEINGNLLSIGAVKYIIIDQADTIEELCDGVYVEDKNNAHNWFIMEISEYQNTSNADKKYMAKEWIFYALIKTDEGLIYVAKMNDKGELELI